ncbi:DUF2637 domain-containing protein [Streptomyces antibioticus]|uniref:DUF2637 domain-containing protein n=1 Tax=Streptomyces antibioticus TaxID=1890 RepID=UPI0033AC393F
MADQQPTHPTPRSVPFRLAVLAAALTIGLTGVTFWLSYEALHNLAAGHGLRGERAWAWPATIDAFIVIGEVLILRASLLRRVDWLAVILTAAGSVGSIVLNVASAGDVDRMTKVVHAVPPCAALLIFTALMRQIYRALAQHTAQQTPVIDPSTSVDSYEATPVVERVDEPAAEDSIPVMPPMPDEAPALPAAEEQRPEFSYSDRRCYAIRLLYDAGYRPTTTEMRTALEFANLAVPSPSTLRGVLRAEIERYEPHLAALPTRPSPLHRAG